MANKSKLHQFAARETAVVGDIEHEFEGVSFIDSQPAWRKDQHESRFALPNAELRKQNILEEANAIGAACLRTQVLADVPGETIRNQLHEYTNVRIQFGNAGNDWKPVIVDLDGPRSGLIRVSPQPMIDLQRSF